MVNDSAVWLQRLGRLLLLVAAGAAAAAVNWHRIWIAFVDEASGGVPVVAWEAQASFQRWVVVALIAVVGAIASLHASEVARTRDQADAAHPRDVATPQQRA